MADEITRELDILTAQFVERSIIERSALKGAETDAKIIRYMNRPPDDGKIERPRLRVVGGREMNNQE